eukprot:2192069-Rhodomonas_salina.1
MDRQLLVEESFDHMRRSPPRSISSPPSPAPAHPCQRADTQPPRAGYYAMCSTDLSLLCIIEHIAGRYSRSCCYLQTPYWPLLFHPLSAAVRLPPVMPAWCALCGADVGPVHRSTPGVRQLDRLADILLDEFRCQLSPVPRQTMPRADVALVSAGCSTTLPNRTSTCRLRDQDCIGCVVPYCRSAMTNLVSGELETLPETYPGNSSALHAREIWGSAF